MEKHYNEVLFHFHLKVLSSELSNANFSGTTHTVSPSSPSGLPFLFTGPDLVHSGHYNKMSQTGYLMNNRILFPIVLEAGNSKIKALADLVSGGSQTL